MLDSLVVDPARALAEVQADYATTTELAETLQRAADVPFRISHHFASDLVTDGRANGLKPAGLRFVEAPRSCSEVTGAGALPLDEATSRRSLSAQERLDAAFAKVMVEALDAPAATP